MCGGNNTLDVIISIGHSCIVGIITVLSTGRTDVVVTGDGAELISFGAMTAQPLQISAADLLFRGITVKGFWGANPPVKPERIGQLLGELIADAAGGKLKMPVETIYSIDAIAEAVAASGEPGRKGKIAIRG